MNSIFATHPFFQQSSFPFQIQDNQVLIARIPLSRLAQQAGATPFFAYDRAVIIQNICTLRAQLGPNIHLHYALKANPMPAVVQALAAQVDGFDVASAHELRQALDTPILRQNISFAGPGKRLKELKQAIAAQVTLYVESATELQRIMQIAESEKQVAQIALRINPACQLNSSGLKMGGVPSAFGIDEADLPELLQSALMQSPYLAFIGLHFYNGSQNLQAQSIIDNQAYCLALVERLSALLPQKLQINLGGGFGVPYAKHHQPLETAKIGLFLQEMAQKFSQHQLIIELGRYLAANAGVYVCQILDQKMSQGKHFLITDGGMHHHLAASGNLGQTFQRNYPILIGNRVQASSLNTSTIHGPLCTPLDILAKDIALPKAHIGDFVAVFLSGAYAATASPQNFLSHPPPIEMLL